MTKCYDCGLPYGSKHWVDVVLSDEDWELINPSDTPGAGLLCFNCIAARAADINKTMEICLNSGYLTIKGNNCKPKWKS